MPQTAKARDYLPFACLVFGAILGAMGLASALPYLGYVPAGSVTPCEAVEGRDAPAAASG